MVRLVRQLTTVKPVKQESLRTVRLVVTGGGTGGHFFPIVAVVEALRAKAPHIEFETFFVGAHGAGEESLFEAGIKPVFIPAGKIPRYLTPRLLAELLKIPLACIAALWHLWRIMPDAVFSKGGFGGIAPLVAARLFGIPAVIHESDAVPGLANRFSVRFARRIAFSFPRAQQYFPASKSVLTGNPVRQALAHGDRARAIERFSISFRPVVLVLGGSQGAQELNAIILDSLPELLKMASVIHQCGAKNIEDVLLEKRTMLEAAPGLENRYRAYGFLKGDELADAYAVADLIVSRAGAGSIFEIALAGKPSLLVPLARAAANHQLLNAEAFQRAGACELLLGATVGPQMFLKNMQTLLTDQRRLDAMSAAAAQFAKPDAASRIADEILSFLE